MFWRSLEEKNNPEQAADAAAAEFSQPPLLDKEHLTRRHFLELSSASAALVGLQACIRRPEEKILPFTRAPEYALPGIPVHYATTISLNKELLGLLVTAIEGRPIKIEGNPDHPENNGATDGTAQAEIWNLYDPDRARGISKPISNASKQASNSGKHKQPAQKLAFADFEKEAAARLQTLQARGGAGLAILTASSNSPSVLRLRQAVLKRFPKAKFYYDSLGCNDHSTKGAQLAYGQPFQTRWHLAGASVLVSFDADFCAGWSGVRHTRDFAALRRLRSPSDAMNRLYTIESALTLTGANADHRLRLPASRIEGVVMALAKTLVEQHGVAIEGLTKTGTIPKVEGVSERWLNALAKDLVKNRSKSLLMAGPTLTAEAHALVHAINHSLGNVGKTLTLHPEPFELAREQVGSLDALAQAAGKGEIDSLFILEGNPVYSAPATLRFGENLRKVPFSVHLATHVDETSSLCSWHLPRAHALETWGDAVTTEGLAGVQQPLIAPLFNGKSELELLAWISGSTLHKGYDLVRETWDSWLNEEVQLTDASRRGRTFKKMIQEGFFATPLAAYSLLSDKGEVDLAALSPALDTIGVSKAVGDLLSADAPAISARALEVTFRLDSKLHDGRFANNPWLLELPDPVTRISWDNVANFSPKTAAELGVKSGDLVELASSDGQKVKIAAWILPGQPDNSISVNLGWGREQVGRYGQGHGFNVAPFRPATDQLTRTGVTVRKLGARYPLSQTQEHDRMEQRPIAIDATYAEYKKEPTFASYRSVQPSTGPLWKEVEYKGHKWGMTIDLSACTGCAACVIACQAENNTPSVGKEQIARGREMYWLRIDRYFVGEDENNPDVAFQPLACVHCENAPCENVCPVNATEHSPEGLNDMAYNRCIGTRYCANNCPYKVRRFNYLDFHGDTPEPLKMRFNPNVTVRMRGVMEKCTYCVQRIESVRIDAKRQDIPIKDGDIKTACQQACPAQAIVFGDLNDPSSRALFLSNLDRSYKLLAEIGTKPRTTYLAKIRNPNVEIGNEASSDQSGRHSEHS